MTEDPYVDPSTGVLINLLGLTDGEALARSEAEYVTLGIYELDQHPLPGAYDVDHLQAFHRHLFGDVYPWVGDFRSVNISRSAPFGDWRHNGAFLDQVFTELATERQLTSLDRNAFVRRLAHYLGDVNAAHPFREGNGRTQRAFFRQLARNAGWNLRWSTVDASENVAASEASLMGDNGPLEALLDHAVERL